MVNRQPGDRGITCRIEGMCSFHFEEIRKNFKNLENLSKQHEKCQNVHRLFPRIAPILHFQTSGFHQSNTQATTRIILWILAGRGRTWNVMSYAKAPRKWKSQLAAHGKPPTWWPWDRLAEQSHGKVALGASLATGPSKFMISCKKAKWNSQKCQNFHVVTNSV